MTQTIHTIGHSNQLLETFLDHLHARDITCLVDVRSSPHSRYAVHFNREALERPLRREGIEYRWVGDLLGGRLVLPVSDESGHAFYQRLTADPRFSRGIAELEALASSVSVAVMCSEGDPLRCHRAIVIGRRLGERGWDVRHILPDERVMDQSAVREELLSRARPVQANLWDTAPVDEAADAYTQQENAIAPRWQGASGADEEDIW